MTCPSELTCSRYADGALARDEAATLERHLAGCALCRATVGNFSAERHALHEALLAGGAAAAIPAFVPRPTFTGLLAWLGGMVLAAWAINAAWLSVSAALPDWLGWLTPDATGIGIDLIVGGLAFLAADGLDLAAAATQTAQLIALAAVCTAGLWLLARRIANPARSLCLTLGATLALTTMAPPGHAFELRRDDNRVTIPAGETIDDTLLVLSDNVLVEGIVTGDLIALGENVTVRGRVDGNLVVAAEALSVEGAVAGSVLAAGETLHFRNAALGANLVGIGSSITVHADTSIAGNLALAAEEAELHGAVGRDLLTATKDFSLFGNVAGNFTAYGEQVDLTSTARIGGDLTARLKSADHLQVAAGAEVQGETNLTAWPEEPNRYLTFEYYLGETLKLLAAFIAGLVLFTVFPALNRRGPASAVEALTAAGIGAIVLVATPVLAGITILTLIGAPLGIAAFMLWLVALYAAGIVTAGVVGRLLLADERHGLALPLVAGLVILFVLINVPLVGGLVRLVAVAVGLGLIVMWLRELWANRIA